MKEEHLHTDFTPPRNIYTMLPDYIHGRLIFEDQTGDDNCRWVVYDGRKFYRCPSRAAAERLAAEMANEAKPELDNLYLAQHHAARCAQVLRRAAQEPDTTDIQLHIEALSVQARRLADMIDTIISQTI